MHILFLTDNYPPEVNAPASRTFEHCREWVKAGHRVTVITCAPNAPQGAVFEGYRNRLWQREDMAGIKVIRVWSYITRNEGFSKRILDYLSYMVTSILASFFVRKPDIIIGTSPQFFTACSAYVVAIFKWKPWVFELRDLWPESIRAVGAMKQSRVLDALEKAELYLYRQTNLIITVTNAFKANLGRRGIDVNKVHVVTNGVDIGRFKRRSKDLGLAHAIDLKGQFTVGYIGTHGLAHALGTLVEAAKILENEGRMVRFIMLGDGAQKADVRALAEAYNLQNMIFLDTVSKDQVVRYLSLLDVAIIHLKKSDLFKTVIPSKMFECMAMSVPILHGVEGESADIITSNDVGLTFEPQNAQELADRIVHLMENPVRLDEIRKKGPVAACLYDRKELAMAMLEHLENTADQCKELRNVKM